MKWSWRIGTIAGIPLYIHATFVLVLVWVLMRHLLQGAGLRVAIEGVVFILAIFGCVVLHEFGHALTAKRYGVRTRDITLLPIGGVARLERMPDDPKQELLVALAGPAVNVVIAGVLYVILAATGTFDPIEALGVTGGSMLHKLMLVNIALVVFNLIPAFPMDGGRVLRALLAMRLDYARATQVAAVLGQGIAFLFGLLGLFTNPFLMFIALFVWIGASQEAGMVQMRAALGGIPVRQAMLTDFKTVSADDPLGHAVELILSGSQQDFPVLEAERVIGVLTRGDLLVMLAQRGRDVPVRDAMKCGFQTAEPWEMLDDVFVRVQTSECRTLPVLAHGKLVGLMTMENLGEFLMIQAALGKAQKAAGVPTARPAHDWPPQGIPMPR